MVRNARGWIALWVLGLWCGAGCAHKAQAPQVQEVSLQAAGEEEPAPLPEAEMRRARPAATLVGAGEDVAWSSAGRAEDMADAGGEPPDPAQPDDPRIVYQADVTLEVPRVVDAQKDVERIAGDLDGYVVSMDAETVRIRIPAPVFRQALDAVYAVGTVVDRRISAWEITEQYRDLSMRRRILDATRQHLLALLEHVGDTKERLRILQEVRRLSEQIDAIDAQLRTFDELVAYSTITVHLVAKNGAPPQEAHRSPFAWIRELRPFAATLPSRAWDVRMEVPEGFVRFDKARAYVAQAADGTEVRAAVIENDPVGDTAFWMEAVRYEMEGREETVREAGNAGDAAFAAFENVAIAPRVYLVGVVARGDDLLVVEAVFPTVQAYEEHSAAVRAALATAKPR